MTLPNSVYEPGALLLEAVRRNSMSIIAEPVVDFRPPPAVLLSGSSRDRDERQGEGLAGDSPKSSTHGPGEDGSPCSPMAKSSSCSTSVTYGTQTSTSYPVSSRISSSDSISSSTCRARFDAADDAVVEETEAVSQCSATTADIDEAMRRADSPASAPSMEETQLLSEQQRLASSSVFNQHALGLCRPCPFVLSGSCEDGPLCKFCHICRPGMQALHDSGNCRPCIFFQKGAGCSSGAECKFCHLTHDARLLHKRHLRKGRGPRKAAAENTKTSYAADV